ncbi:hypothetical protein K1T71_011340 [Dendrolimus kikuchii]|uniref:Uncharacterized protein n=1 Tax=Dendrolimus kikuchii TaxID=765133 RepID=A0ACC1CNH0_9NEOP|nr:hypothetical protein K1T71_011340 [Dendrolimus kikuchii]
MSFIGKEYKFVKQENFDGFLKSAGVPEDKIERILQFQPSQTLLKDGDTYTYVNVTPRGKKETQFKLGVEFDDVIGSDTAVKSTYTIDGNTVTQVAKSKDGTATFKREYNGDDLVVTITNDRWDGVAKRYYKA